MHAFFSFCSTYHSERFEEESNIYHPTKQKWFSASTCLWTESTSIQNKTAIATAFPSLQGLFVDILGVKKPTVHMYIRELKILASKSTPKIDDIKALIMEINMHKPKQKDLEILKESQFVPVKPADKPVVLMHPGDSFAIVDREEYAEIFCNIAPTFDFDMRNVGVLKPFIEAFGWNKKYLSNCVHEKSTFRSATPSSSLTADFHARALAIFR